MNVRRDPARLSSDGPSSPERPEPAGQSPYAAFAVYGALDDVALAALGNRGLLRRGPDASSPKEAPQTTAQPRIQRRRRSPSGSAGRRSRSP